LTAPSTLLITGGSRGIGAETARLAGSRGYHVCVNYLRDEAAAEQVAAAIRRAGGQAAILQGDVGKDTDIEHMFGWIDSNLPPLRGLVNNAGILSKQMRLEGMDAARLRRIFEVNSIGPMLCAREAVLRMARSRGGAGGVIVNVSSIAARLGAPNEYIDYAASKGALDTFTLGLAREVAGEGIRVNGVRPGTIHTEIHASGGDPERANRLGPSIPMGRSGDSLEIAQAIMWLLSDEASYVTGAILDVSGGR
jgi:NAD(P)-dependent dehydrogenase (short-subunit alcohol dehydrogenase family)